MPYLPWFPEPGSFIRYFDWATRLIKYKQLVWRRDPFTYPRRLPAVAAGSKGDNLTFRALNPSVDKRHLLLAYFGVKPGFLYYLWHPFDVKALKWDETSSDILIIDEDLTAVITYESSPYEFPTKAIAIERDRYPAIQARNIQDVSSHPEVVWVGAMYVVRNHDDLSEEELARLQAGTLRSYPWDLGGEF